METTYKQVNGLDGLKQVLNGLRQQIKSPSSSRMSFGGATAKPINPDTYIELKQGNMRAFIHIHIAGGTADVRFSEVDEHNASPGLRALFKDFLNDICGHKDKNFEENFYSKYFIDANQVTTNTVQRTYSAAEPLKGTIQEREARARSFVEGTLTPAPEISTSSKSPG